MFIDFTGTIEGWVSPWELRFLYSTAILDRELPGGILEVGCYQGLSTSALMQADDHRMTVCDIFTAMPDHQQRGRFEYNVREVMNVCQLQHFIDVQEMPSSQFFLEKAHWYGSHFRLIFIDGDHSRRGAAADFYSSSHLLCPGGSLIFDDCNMADVADAADDLLPGWVNLDGKFAIWRKGGASLR